MRAGLPASSLGVLMLWACSLVSPDAPLQCYIVQLTAPPLVSYTGGIPGLASTSPQTGGRNSVDIDSPASRAYIDYLKQQQAKLLAAVKDSLGRTVDPDYAYFYAMDAVVLRLTPAEAARVTTLPSVRVVLIDQANRTLSQEVPPRD